MTDDLDRFVQEPVDSVDRLERLLEEGKAETADDFAYVGLDDAKYIVVKSDSDVGVRYHHDKGLDREDVEDIDAIQIGEDGEPISFDVEPDLGIDTAEVPPGTAAMLLDIASRSGAMLEFSNPRRDMDFTYMAEDYLENGRDLVTHSPPEGSDSEIALAVEGEEPRNYKLELTLESPKKESPRSVVDYSQTDSPKYERFLVFEGYIK